MKRFNSLLRVAMSSATVAVAFALATSLAAAEPTLYHTTDGSGIDPGAPPNLPLGGTPTIFLWFNPGQTATNSGTICHDGLALNGDNGDDSCGIHFKITVDGDLSIFNFVFEDEYDIAEFTNTGTALNVSIVTTALADILPADTATKVASFQVDATGAQGGFGNLTFLQSVDAGVELVTGNGRPLFFVPEPALVLQLAFGALGLAALDRHRRLRQAGGQTIRRAVRE